MHAAGDTKSEHFEPARVRKLNKKQFIYITVFVTRGSHFGAQESV
jgi:hypothetical protein